MSISDQTEVSPFDDPRCSQCGEWPDHCKCGIRDAVRVETVSAPQPKRKRRAPRKLTDSEWLRIQTHYETDPEKIGLRPLATLYDMPEQTMMKRAAQYKWQRRDAILVDAKREIEQSTRQAIKQVAAEVSQEIARKTLEDLQPWIERKKRRHIKSLVNLGEKGISRVRKLMKEADPTSPKEEAFTSKTADTWDNIIRRNLGMNDGTSFNGSLSVNILTRQAAVQFSAGPQLDTDDKA